MEGSTTATLSCVPSKVMMAEGTVGTLLRLPCVSDTRWQGRPIDHRINRCAAVVLNTAGDSACQRAASCLSTGAELLLSTTRWQRYLVSPLLMAVPLSRSQNVSV